MYNNTLSISPINECNTEYIEKISSDSSTINIKSNKDNLFFLTYNELEEILSNNRDNLPAILNTTTTSTPILHEINNIHTPTLPIISINSVFYKTIELSNTESIVQFWHEALNQQTMAKIVRGGLLKNLPPELTIGAINQHFRYVQSAA